jgi:hypothetical protein
VCANRDASSLLLAFTGSIAAAIVSIVALPARPQLGLVSKIVVSAYGLSF